MKLTTRDFEFLLTSYTSSQEEDLDAFGCYLFQNNVLLLFEEVHKSQVWLRLTLTIRIFPIKKSLTIGCQRLESLSSSYFQRMASRKIQIWSFPFPLKRHNKYKKNILNKHGFILSNIVCGEISKCMDSTLILMIF